VLIDLGLLYALVLGPSILEPDLNLRFGQAKRLGQLEPTAPGDVLVPVELHFKTKGLLRTESRPLAALSSLLATPSSH